MQQARLRPYFTDLDGMRGVLAVIVMLFHLGLNPLIARATSGLLRGGLWTLCVDYFFVLSGFVLYFSLERSRPTTRRYFIKRLRRLAPVFMLGTIAMAPFVSLPWPIWLANLAMVQSILVLPSIDHPSWSIPFELFLPALALPLLGPLGRTSRRGAVGLLIGALVATATFALLLAFNTDFVFDQQIRGGRAAAGLALGIVLGRVHQLSAPGPDRGQLVLGCFASIMLIMLLAQRFPPIAAAFPAASAICVFFGAQSRTFLSSGPLQALGRWSYSIYLLHVPILTLVAAAAGGLEGNVAGKIFVIAGTIVASAIVFRFVERPLMEQRARPAQTAP